MKKDGKRRLFLSTVLHTAHRIHGFAAGNAEYGEERTQKRHHQRHAEHHHKRNTAEYEKRIRHTQHLGNHAVEKSHEDNRSRQRKDETDRSDNRRFGKEDFEHVRSPCPDGAENADFVRLVGNGYGDKVEKQKRRKYAKSDPDVEKYSGQKRQEIIHAVDLGI